MNIDQTSLFSQEIIKLSKGSLNIIVNGEEYSKKELLHVPGLVEKAFPNRILGVFYIRNNQFDNTCCLEKI